MTGDSDDGGPDVRGALLGAAVAGVVSVVVLVALTAADIGSSPLRIAFAILVGVVVAQAYERL
jgi:hypothetical protein